MLCFLFQYHPDIALSNLVNNLKSVTSRKLRQEFSDYLSSFYCKDVFWNGSYFVASCGGITISTLRRYIKNQNQPDCSDNP
ncbi:MAG: IS200/IS605 family transposase [Planktothrix sp.]|uniref:IS200/IS605 family transposase n=1 Tax=Planktothrix sp. TaxID=3088171 RepID=UPI0038D4C785